MDMKNKAIEEWKAKFKVINKWFFAEKLLPSQIKTILLRQIRRYAKKIHKYIKDINSDEFEKEFNELLTNGGDPKILEKFMKNLIDDLDKNRKKSNGIIVDCAVFNKLTITDLKDTIKILNNLYEVIHNSEHSQHFNGVDEVTKLVENMHEFNNFLTKFKTDISIEMKRAKSLRQLHHRRVGEKLMGDLIIGPYLKIKRRSKALKRTSRKDRKSSNIIEKDNKNLIKLLKNSDKKNNVSKLISTHVKTINDNLEYEIKIHSKQSEWVLEIEKQSRTMYLDLKDELQQIQSMLSKMKSDGYPNKILTNLIKSFNDIADPHDGTFAKDEIFDQYVEDWLYDKIEHVENKAKDLNHAKVGDLPQNNNQEFKKAA